MNHQPQQINFYAVLDMMIPSDQQYYLHYHILFSIIRSYNHKTMMLYCPMVAETVLNIWCSVARLLLRLPCFSFMFIPSWNYDDLLSRCSSSGHEHMVFCCLLTTPTIFFQFYDHTILKTMMIYCPTGFFSFTIIWS